jgi:CDP-diacylglycerol---serine O-phosphatidyltransferase
MKHLPNLLTLANLFCGCIAIAYILSAQPYYIMSMGESGLPTWRWVFGAEQMYYGSIFIVIAAICDMFDGLAARALNIHSPIGKDLDSLADVVSFGVAPSVIMYKLLWDARMGDKNAFDASMIYMAPAFLIACFAALRLAKFNVTSNLQKGHFIGMPTPAVGLFVATFPIVMWYNPYNIAAYFQNKWLLYLIIALLCWLMVSTIRFIKFVPAKWSFPYFWPQLVLIIGTAVAIPFLHVAALPFAFILYVILSMIYKEPGSPAQS